MQVVYTDDALKDIDDILTWLAGNIPSVVPAVSQRIESVVARISRWPRSARVIQARPGVCAVPLGRYPYVIFYRLNADTVEILHIHHTARGAVDDDQP